MRIDLIKNPETINYPILITSALKKLRAFILTSGWYQDESDHTWSSTSASLNLPVPKSCQKKACSVVLKFSVYGASEKKPIAVEFSTKYQGGNWQKILTANGDGFYQVSLPLEGEGSTKEFAITIPNATSPKLLLDSPDKRILGISLMRIDLLNTRG